ncbi:Hypothetical predicted protein [Cloeon dipterum]|uniref:Uncharacterized protein n=1 Tax=Cloeon dipterum TaxID=197152 RepID=A0A8S1DVL2_9INSE|nr:Hypothetical predicted protein [Cloeon dipterum]
MDKPPKYRTKRYNVVSGVDKNKKKVYQQALILYGPGSQQQMLLKKNEMKEGLQSNSVASSAGILSSRPQRDKRMNKRFLETADESDENESQRRKKMKPKEVIPAHTFLLHAIEKAKGNQLTGRREIKPAETLVKNSGKGGLEYSQKRVRSDSSDGDGAESVVENRAQAKRPQQRSTETKTIETVAKKRGKGGLEYSQKRVRSDSSDGDGAESVVENRAQAKRPQQRSTETKTIETVAKKRGKGGLEYSQKRVRSDSSDGDGAESVVENLAQAKGPQQRSTETKTIETVAKKRGKGGLQNSQKRVRSDSSDGDGAEDGYETNYDGPGSTQVNKQLLNEKRDAAKKSKTVSNANNNAAAGKVSVVQKPKANTNLLGEKGRSQQVVRAQNSKSQEMDDCLTFRGLFTGLDNTQPNDDNLYQDNQIIGAREAKKKNYNGVQTEKEQTANHPSCCCRAEMAEMLKHINQKLDTLLLRGGANAVDAEELIRDPEEPELFQVVKKKYIYIGKYFVLLRERMSGVMLYTKKNDPRDFTAQLTHAVYGDSTLKHSRLVPEKRGQNYGQLNNELVEAIFLCQGKYCQMKNSEPLSMTRVRREISHACQRAKPESCRWPDKGYYKLEEVIGPINAQYSDDPTDTD